MTSDTARRALVALLVTLAACSSEAPFGGGGNAPVAADDDVASPPDEGPSPFVPDGTALPVDVRRVADGDSVRADADGVELEIRLLGVNAPEGDECYGDEARARLEELLAEGEVELRPWPAATDDFGRTLGYLTAGDVFVNLALLSSGHAVARDQSNHAYARQFEDAEAEAASAGRGVWAPDACGVATDARLEIVELMANAPGDDRRNPNGEYVVIENVGEDEADLTGWTIRDESTRHRYTFPEVIVRPGQRARLRTGCGEDDIGATPIELFWCDPEPPVWNNDGDTAFLLDSGGNTVDFFRS